MCRFRVVFSKLLCLLVITAIGLPHSARAIPSDYAFDRIPSHFLTRELTAGSRALGEVCHSRRQMPDGTVCNPAYLHLSQENALLARIYVGNGYSAISTANKFLFEPLSQQFLQELFQKQSATSLEANLGLAFTARNFSATFSPYRVQYIAEVHNPNLPVVAVSAALERQLTFASGTSLGFVAKEISDFSIGGSLRLVERTFVHNSFSLPQTVTDNPRSLLPVQKQKGIFFEPSLGWSRTVYLPWKFHSAMTVRNLGKAWPYSSLYSELTDLEWGFGIERPFGVGTINLGIDLVNVFRGTSLENRLRAGTSYKFGIMEIMAGANDTALSAGMQFGIQFIQGGIVYEFMRSDTAGRPLENRIATEVTIKL